MEKYRMKQNLHTHSTFCDGKDTPEEMILRAIELGFNSIGFSGHANTVMRDSCEMRERVAGYKQDWGKWYQDGGLVLSDRYTTSNAVHQASKEPEESRAEYLRWLYEFEYDRLGLPRPDLTIYLDVPTDFTERLMRRREQDTCTQADIHEQDLEYLSRCRKSGRAAAEFYEWTVIDCVRDGAMRTIEDIHNEIYGYVAAMLEE